MRQWTFGWAMLGASMTAAVAASIAPAALAMNGRRPEFKPPPRY